MNAIMPNPPTETDYRNLQRECYDIAQPFVKQLSALYLRARFCIIYSPVNPNVPPQIIYDCDGADEIIKLKMKTLIDQHVAKFNEKFGIKTA